MDNPWNFFRYRYLISLKHRTERRAQVQQHLRQHNLQYALFDAIDGRRNPHLRQYLIDSNVLAANCELRPGQIGCLASHRFLWQQLLLGIDGTEPFWTLIMEDDIRFHPGLSNQLLSAYLMDLPADARFFRLAFLAHGKHAANLRSCSNYWLKFTGVTFSTLCYAVHSDFLQPLLRHTFTGPVDCIALTRSYGMKRIDDNQDFYRYQNPVGDFEEHFYGIAAPAKISSDTAH